MRLKYQLRGLGIGIILTAALLMIFSDDGDAQAKTEDTIVMASTEEETTEEAVESESSITMSEMQEEKTTVDVEEISSVEESASEEETETVFEEGTEVTSEEVQVIQVTEVASIEERETQESSVEIASTENESVEMAENATDMITIKIVSGDDSGTVARKLQTAGLVDNASEYDAYLMQHGYDKRISVGEVKIKTGSTWLEIAEKISGK